MTNISACDRSVASPPLDRRRFSFSLILLVTQPVSGQKFVKVFPQEFRRVLKQRAAAAAQTELAEVARG